MGPGRWCVRHPGLLTELRRLPHPLVPKRVAQPPKSYEYERNGRGRFGDQAQELSGAAGAKHGRTQVSNQTSTQRGYDRDSEHEAADPGGESPSRPCLADIPEQQAQRLSYCLAGLPASEPSHSSVAPGDGLWNMCTMTSRPVSRPIDHLEKVRLEASGPPRREASWTNKGLQDH